MTNYMGFVWDISRNYLIAKTNREAIPKGKRYLVLNLQDKGDRTVLLAYAAATPNLELREDIAKRVLAHEMLVDYRIDRKKAARHSDDPLWSSPCPPPSIPPLAQEERKGLYAKYEILTRNADPAQGDYFVLSVDENSPETEAALAILNKRDSLPGY